MRSGAWRRTHVDAKEKSKDDGDGGDDDDVGNGERRDRRSGTSLIALNVEAIEGARR